MRQRSLPLVWLGAIARRWRQATASALVVVACPSLSQPAVANEGPHPGEAAARALCSACHQFPEPALLDRESWGDGVLPMMGAFLGIKEFQGKRYPRIPESFAPPSGLPTTVGEEMWQSVLDYYESNAPASLARPQRAPLTVGGEEFPFVAEPSRVTGSQTSPAVVSALTLDPPSGQTFVGVASKKLVLFLDPSLNVRKVMRTGTSPVWLGIVRDGLSEQFSQPLLGVAAASVLPPNDLKNHGLALVPLGRDTTPEGIPLYVAQDLPRPAHAASGDFDGDGNRDFVVCGFGGFHGELQVYFGDGNGEFVSSPLVLQPGSIQVLVRDADGDGDSDLLCLMSHGDERIVLLENLGKRAFAPPRDLLRFPPVYGSDFFELVDLDGDGLEDILYTCGDNADYSQVFKPYHGVYGFRNMGDWNFSSEPLFFLPVDGCYKALARDFDDDGDLDIATVAFFADFTEEQPRSFVYFRNEGAMTFKAFTFPEVGAGRWITMDAGDIDGDGDEDLAIGNFARPVPGPSKIPPELLAKWIRGPLVYRLRNTTR